MRLFSEKVENTLSNSPLNILQIENFEEIFFDVYEIELNKKKYLVEKISEYRGNPVVSVPVTIKGKELLYPFILQKGKFEVCFNEKNSFLLEEYEPQTNEAEKLILEEDIELTNITPTNWEDQLEDRKQSLLKEIQIAKIKAREDAIQLSERLKAQKLEEAREKIIEWKQTIDTSVEESKTKLINEFLEISNTLREDIRKEILADNNERYEEIKESVDNVTSALADALKEEINTNFELREEILENKIESLVDETINAFYDPRIEARIHALTSKLFDNIDEVKLHLEHQISEKAHKDIELDVNVLRTETVELHNTLEKGFQKAYSRIGNVKKLSEDAIDGLEINLLGKLGNTKDSIEKYFSKRLEQIEEKSFDISAAVRKELIDLINESKETLLEKLKTIEIRPEIEYIVEKNNKKSLDEIELDIDKKINDKISDEFTRLKKYINIYSGGGSGSVAQQFANGGTMNGDLIVVGSLSAGEYLGITIPSSDYLPLSGGTINGNLNVTGTLSALSATFTVIDVKQYELSGFQVTGDLTISGDLSASDTIYATHLGSHTEPISTIHLNHVHFEPSVTPPPYEEGMVFYDADDKTLSLYADQAGVALQIGQEMWVRVVNKTGTDITNGQVVYIDGAQGNRPTVALAIASDEDSSHKTIGVATQSIPNNNNGYITTFGLVRDLDLSAFTEGDILYLALSAGGLTNIKPSSPNHSIRIGEVVSNSATEGILLVNTDVGGDMDNLHDTNIINPQNGDIISYNTSLSSWVNTTVTPLLSVTNLSAGDLYVQNKVGIGTTTPSAKLQIDTASAGTKGLIVKGAASQTANLQEWQDSSGNILSRLSKDGAYLFGSAAGTSYTYAGLGPYVDIAYGGVPGALIIGADNNLTTRTNNATKIGRIGGVPYTNTNKAIAMIATYSVSSGNSTVQIGGGTSTMEPATNLEFYSGPMGGTGTIAMSINSSQNIGIGTTPTTNRLVVSQNSTTPAIYVTGGTHPTIRIGNTINAKLQTVDGSGFALFGTENNYAVRVVTNNVERMTFTSSGNVGIGTTTPNENLTVVGNISATGNTTVLGQITAPNQTLVNNEDVVTKGLLDTYSTEFVSGSGVDTIVKLTKAQYDALTPDENTFYIITDDTKPLVTEYRSETSDYTITLDDHTIFASGVGLTITLPSAATCGGQIFNVKATSGNFTLSAVGAETIDGASTVAATSPDCITVQSDNTNWWII